MNTFIRLVATLGATACFATSSVAMTVTFTQTATVAGIEDYFSQQGGTLQSYSPVAGQSISLGETMTHTFKLDLNASPLSKNCFVAGSCSAVYATSMGQISFSGGYGAGLVPHVLSVHGTPVFAASTTPFDPHAPFPPPLSALTGYNISHEYRLPSGSFSGSSCSRPIGVYGLSSRTFVPGSFDAKPSDVIANIGSSSINYMTLRFDQSFLTNTQGPCQIGINVSFTNVQSSIRIDTDPNMTPVPLPAPAAMLGLALAGLVGFGRARRKA